ncbi:MAG TPA: prepilin peptidase [Gemmatimonas sp.]|nr:prepilin peptidase [Gemmatimonas sp.]
MLPLTADFFLMLLLPAFVVGASIGSFLNVCIARWPADLSVIRPRSRCPKCERPIAWSENIPVVGWLLLRGKCRGCELPISIQYPAVELLVALGWVTCVLYFGPTFEALRVAVFGTVLLGIAVTDAKHYLIPDGFTVTGLVLVLVATLANFFIGESSHFATPGPAILGACVGAGAITIIGWLAEVAMKREAMGFGDTTLMAVVGAALGPERALLTIVGGAAVGAVFFVIFVGPVVWIRSRRTGEEFAFPDVPFGVFLAPAAMLALLWGDQAIVRYMQHAFPS